MDPAVKLFLSYSHADITRRKEFFPFLKMLSEEYKFSIWVDEEIKVGDNWEPTILKSLESSQIIVLLISPDFMLSHFCTQVEMQVALKKHESRQAIIIPVLVRPLPDGNYPFDYIQALPEPDNEGSRAVSIYHPGPDAAWKNVVDRMRDKIQPLIQDWLHCDIDAREQRIITSIEQDNIPQALIELIDFCTQFAEGQDEYLDDAMTCKSTYESFRKKAADNFDVEMKVRLMTVKSVYSVIRSVKKAPLKAINNSAA